MEEQCTQERTWESLSDSRMGNDGCMLWEIENESDKEIHAEDCVSMAKR